MSTSLSLKPSYPFRSKKRVCLCCVIVTIIFSLAASLPFIIQCLASPPSSISRSNFVPLQNVYHQIYDRDDALLDRLEPAVHVSDKDLAFSLPTILQQVYISVKTTQRFHYPRLVILLETWASQVRDHVWFFTDSDTSDSELVKRTGDHLIVTNCSSSHHRLSLCCKMEQEFQYFLRSHRQWWCHFDDDNFVNVVALGNMLEKYDSDKSWYLGKTSTASPLKIMTMDRKVWKVDKDGSELKDNSELFILVCHWRSWLLCVQDSGNEDGSLCCVSLNVCGREK